MSNKNYRLIGLTGPTGAGKSSVSSIFERYGFAVVNADEIAHKALEDTACKESLTQTFGKEILNPDGTINRKSLAKSAFANSDNTKKLNDLTHPVIIRLSQEAFEELSADYKSIIFDAPTLFEAGMDTMCDLIISVAAPLELRTKRITERDNLTKEQALARISAQHENSFYTDRSDYVIVNDCDLDTLTMRTEKIIKEII